MDEKQLEVLRYTAAHARVLEMVLLGLVARLSAADPTIGDYVTGTVRRISEDFAAEGSTLEALVADRLGDDLAALLPD